LKKKNYNFPPLIFLLPLLESTANYKYAQQQQEGTREILRKGIRGIPATCRSINAHSSLKPFYPYSAIYIVTKLVGYY